VCFDWERHTLAGRIDPPTVTRPVGDLIDKAVHRWCLEAHARVCAYCAPILDAAARPADAAVKS
jgi:hypothetical protein